VSRKLLDAQENERRWLSRELHDDISQRLWLIHLRLGILKDGDASLAECRQGIDNAMQQLSDLSTDIQRLSHRLHSSHLELLGLAAAAAGYCGEVGDQHNAHVELRAENIPRDLPPEIALSIFRVLQEAVHNAIKHSGASRCEVFLNHDSNAIQLTVRDSGRGFDTTQAMTGHGLGLTSMKERVTLVGGNLSIESQPGNGTTVHVRVPLRSATKSANL
jgi:signal transduction histidine kinase